MLAFGKWAMEVWSNAAAATLERTGALRLTAVSSIVNARVTPLRTGIWLGGVFLLCFVYFAPHIDMDQSARIDMAVAIVDHHTFAIDDYQGNTFDRDNSRGHYYSDKAPGSSFAAVPVYLIYKGYYALRGGSPTDPANDLQLRYMESVCLSAIPAMLLLLLFFWTLQYFSPLLFHRAALTLFLGLGTIIFPYAHNYYAHVFVAALLFAAFVLIYVAAGDDTVRGAWTRRLANNQAMAALLAGLGLGMAVLSEYPAAIIAVAIAVYGFIRFPLKTWIYLLIGVAPSLAILLAYNRAVYGNPFTLGYLSGTSFIWRPQQVEGLGGATWPPSLDAIWGMTFSPYRGLFFLSPFLLLALPGYALWRRRGGLEWRLFLVIPLVYFLAIAMYYAWYGGASVGPRYLIPMLPFLTLPIIFTLDALAASRVSRNIVGLLYGLGYSAYLVSIVSVWAESIAGTAGSWPDASNVNPLLSTQLPALLQGGIASDQGTAALGLSGGTSLVLLATLLAAWSLAFYVFPLACWASESSGWLPPGEQPSWGAWQRRIMTGPRIAHNLERLRSVRASLRSLSAGPSPAPAFAGAESGIAVRSEYAILYRPDAGWQLALWLLVGLRAGLGLLGAWTLIAHGVTPIGGWTNVIIETGKSWSYILASWQRWDALWFQQIAENGYHAGNGTFAFGPLYPFLVHVLSLALGGTPVVAELLLSSGAFAASMFLMYCLARLLVGPLTAALTVLLLAFFPTAFLLLAPDSVGLLLALTLLAFWLARDDRLWFAGLAGLAATLTEPVGILAALPVILRVIERWRTQGKPPRIELLSMVLPVLGLLAFNGYLHIAVGEGHWYLPWTGLEHVPNTPIMRRGDPLEILNLIGLGAFAVLAIAAMGRLPSAEVIYTDVLLCMLAASELVAPLTGMAHYALLLFPCYIVLALCLIRRPALAKGCLLLGLLVQGTLFMFWIRFAYLG
jgi:hypothetical protein